MRAESRFTVNVAGFFRGYPFAFLPTLSTDLMVPVPAGGLTFLSLNKKVSKEVSQGEALTAAAPASEPPSPWTPSRRALFECKHRLYVPNSLSNKGETLRPNYMETEVFFTETMGNPKKIGLVDYSERDVSHPAGIGSCCLLERVLANVQGITLEEACDFYRQSDSCPCSSSLVFGSSIFRHAK